jgi:hypothetical protein
MPCCLTKDGQIDQGACLHSSKVITPKRTCFVPKHSSFTPQRLDFNESVCLSYQQWKLVWCLHVLYHTFIILAFDLRSHWKEPGSHRAGVYGTVLLIFVFFLNGAKPKLRRSRPAVWKLRSAAAGGGPWCAECIGGRSCCAVKHHRATGRSWQCVCDALPRILTIVTSLQTRGAHARTCVYPGIGSSGMLHVY